MAVDEAAVEREFLAEFGDPTGRAAHGGAGAAAGEHAARVELLRRALLNEKAAPDILRFETVLVARLREALREREEQLDYAQAATEKDVFSSTILRMDLDRVKYLLMEYLRVRLGKIQRFALHILGDSDIHGRLSDEELQFAKQFIDLEAEHLQRAALSKFPKVYQSFTEQSADADMVPAPNLDSFVFCRVERDLGDFQLDDGESGAPPEVAHLARGDLLAVRFAPIQGLLERGDVQLV